jgi:hypothetical protein
MSLREKDLWKNWQTNNETIDVKEWKTSTAREREYKFLMSNWRKWWSKKRNN